MQLATRATSFRLATRPPASKTGHLLVAHYKWGQQDPNAGKADLIDEDGAPLLAEGDLTARGDPAGRLRNVDYSTSTQQGSTPRQTITNAGDRDLGRQTLLEDEEYPWQTRAFYGWSDAFLEYPDKAKLALYAGVTVLGIYFASSLLYAIDRVPLLPGFLTLVGFSYSSWFAWTYLIFAEGRQRLGKDFDDMKAAVQTRTEALADAADKGADEYKSDVRSQRDSGRQTASNISSHPIGFGDKTNEDVVKSDATINAPKPTSRAAAVGAQKGPAAGLKGGASASLQGLEGGGEDLKALEKDWNKKSSALEGAKYGDEPDTKAGGVKGTSQALGGKAKRPGKQEWGQGANNEELEY